MIPPPKIIAKASPIAAVVAAVAVTVRTILEAVLVPVVYFLLLAGFFFPAWLQQKQTERERFSPNNDFVQIIMLFCFWGFLVPECLWVINVEDHAVYTTHSRMARINIEIELLWARMLWI